MTDPCPAASELIRWLAGELTDTAANAIRMHVASCPTCQGQLPRAARSALVAQVAAAEHIDSFKLSEYADGSLSGPSRQLVRRHLEQCCECEERLALLRRGRVLSDGSAPSETHHLPAAVGTRTTRWWTDAAAILAIALLVVGVWWFVGRGMVAGRVGRASVALPPALLRELPEDKRETMQLLCRNLARTTPISAVAPNSAHRGTTGSPATPAVEIIYPLPGDELPTPKLIVLVRTPDSSPATVEVVAKDTGTLLGRWSIPSDRVTRLPAALDYGSAYAIVARAESDPGLRSEDRIFRTSRKSLSTEVQRLSVACQGNALLLGALYETYGMRGTADRYYAAAAERFAPQRGAPDLYQAWRTRSGLERPR